MVGPPRGPPRPPMAPQPRATAIPPPASQPPQQQIILKQVMPYTMVTKPTPQNFVNYLQLPVMPGNGSFLAVSSKPPETNGTTFLTMSPRPSYIVTNNNNTTTNATNNNNNNNSANTNNNNSTTYIAMESPTPTTPAAHQYLIPKPEPFAMHNYSKNEPSSMAAPLTSIKRRIPIVTRPTNHQRIKEEVEEEEDEGEEVRPVMDPDLPLMEQLVQMDHSYPHWLPPRPPPIDDDDKESTISSDEKPDGGDEGEETETAAEGEDSVTRCICNLEHDDGYMISCDECYVWQHVACVLPDIPMANSLPDMTYLCDLCQPRNLDRNRARALQLQRRKQILHRDESSEDSWSSVDRTAPPHKKAVARRRAEPVQRRPSKSKRDIPNGPMRNRPRVDSMDGPVRTKKPDSMLDPPANRVKLLKPLNRGRRDGIKVPPSPQHMHTPPSVGRRTKFKRKLENKTNLRRRTKSKDVDGKSEREEETKPKVAEQRSSRSAGDRTPAKSRCRLGHAPSGEPILIATCRVVSGEPLTELRGKYLQSSSSSTTPRAEVLYHYRFPRDGTEVVMDGSGRENLMRYARRSCYPNSQLKHYLMKGSLRLYLVATETLEKNQQVTIPHGSVTESIAMGEKETCGKDCTYDQKFIPESATERRRRSRRRTVSEESEGRSVSPVKRSGEAGRPPSPLSPTSDKERKMTREEKKIEQAMKIFAQMEKDTARKRDKERPERSLSGNFRRGGDSDKESPVEGKPRRRRRRRRRRSSRKSRLPSGSGPGMLSHPSGDETDASSGDDLPSPRDKDYSKDSSKEDEEDKDAAMNDAAGLLLALGGARNNVNAGRHTPPNAREHSENDSSPGTPLSSACILVTAAVGPLAPGFKFPKTKKGLMNEWLGKSPEHGDVSPVPDNAPADISQTLGAPKLANLSNRLFYPVREPITGPEGFGKKRWLRQAISEETDMPLGSPPCPPDNVTPLKKRRLARESLTSEPPTTPTHDKTPMCEDDPAGDDNPSEDMVERVRNLQRDYMVAQGIEYDTSPQRVPENLSITRDAMGDGEMSPTENIATPRQRRGRKRPAPKATPRPSPRAKRKLRSGGGAESNAENEEDFESPVLTSIKDDVVDRVAQDSSEPPPVLMAEGVCRVESSESKLDVFSVKRDSDRTEDFILKEIVPTSTITTESDEKPSVLEPVEESDVKPPVLVPVDEGKVLVKEEEEVTKPSVPVVDSETKPCVIATSAANELVAVVEVKEEEVKQEVKVEEVKPQPTSVIVVPPVKDVVVVPPVKVVVVEPPVKDVVVEPPVKDAVETPPLVVQSDVKEAQEVIDLAVSTVVEQSSVTDAVGSAAPSPVKSLDKAKTNDPRKDAKLAAQASAELEENEKCAPAKRKLSITEYLKRKGTSGKKVSTGVAGQLKMPDSKSRPPSPPSDDDISPLLIPTPTLPFPLLDGPIKGGRFKEEPTELERQRENLNERLRREFGLMINDDEPKPPLPPPPPPAPVPVLAPETNGFPESPLAFPVAQPLPQSAIYPEGSSNPPNPFAPNFPTTDRFNFRH